MAGEQQDHADRTPIQSSGAVGDNNKRSIQERLTTLDAVLDEYETKQGLPKFEDKLDKHEEVGQYLSMSRSELEKLSPIHCAEIAAFLSGIAFHVQRAYNREIARVHWAERQIKIAVAPQLSQYRGSFSQQEDQAIRGDDAATKLLSIMIYAQQRADRLHFLSANIQDHCSNLKNLQITKQKRDNYG